MQGLGYDLLGALRQARGGGALWWLQVTTLAVGIAASLVVFVSLRSVLLRPLPYEAPDDLVMVWRVPRDRPSRLAGFRSNEDLSRQIPSTGMFRTWRDGSTSVDGMAAIELLTGPASQIDIRLSDTVQRVSGAAATTNVMSLLGVTPLIGRAFEDSDPADVVLISHRLWMSVFAGDPAVVGATLQLASGRPRDWRVATVIGVLPPDVRFQYPDGIDVWLPLLPQDVEAVSGQVLRWTVVARLARGVPLETAQAEFQTMAEPAMAGRAPESIRLEPVHEYVVGSTRPALMLLTGVTALVLLVACASGASLKFAHVLDRRQRFAIQQSLGASTARLSRQILAEGAVDAMASVLMAAVLIVAAAPALQRIVPAGTPRLDEIALDGVSVLFACGVLVVAAVAVSLGPSLYVVRTLRLDMRGDGSRGSEQWTPGRRVLVAVQSGLITFLMALGITLVFELQRLHTTPVGFARDNVFVADVSLLSVRFDQPGAVVSLRDAVLSALRSSPGVDVAAAASSVPFVGTDIAVIEGGQTDARLMVARRLVDADYFHVMGLSLLEGRFFNRFDASGTPAPIIVSRSLRELMDQMPNAVLQSTRYLSRDVVGVVDDVRALRVQEAGVPAFYAPWESEPGRRVQFVMRADAPVAQLNTIVNEAIRNFAPEQPPVTVRSLESAVAASLANERFGAVATMSLGSIMTIVTILGLAGLVARLVAQRIRELAIRAAVGARPLALVGLLLRQSLGAATFGIAAGFVLAMAATQPLARSGVLTQPPDLASTTTATIIVLLLTIAGCLLPALAVRRMDLSRLLRV